MVFEKVVYVRYLPLTSAIYTDLYFDELLQNNFKVDYLDLTSLFFPDKVSPDSFAFEGTVKITSYQQLKAYLRQQNNERTLYISIMTFESRVFKLHWIFSRFNLKLAAFGRGVFPNSPPDKISEIARILNVLSIGRIALFIANKSTILLKKWGYIKPYDYIFKAGEYGYWGFGMGSEIDYQKAEIVEVNTVDYDQFLSHKEISLSPDEEYLVFLDQYLPYHPDAIYFNLKTVEPEIYFKEVNGFFDKLEFVTGKKVVIAAHPKAEKYKEFNPFNNRLLFFNQSNDLVKNASLVLTHASTAICFPICYEKRIILLMSDYLNEIFPQFKPVVNSIVKSCGATLILMDKKTEIEMPSQIDSILYNDFKYKYLTSKKSENQLSKDIFINFLKSKCLIFSESK